MLTLYFFNWSTMVIVLFSILLLPIYTSPFSLTVNWMFAATWYPCGASTSVNVYVPGSNSYFANSSLLVNSIALIAWFCILLPVIRNLAPLIFWWLLFSLLIITFAFLTFLKVPLLLVKSNWKSPDWILSELLKIILLLLRFLTITLVIFKLLSCISFSTFTLIWYLVSS